MHTIIVMGLNTGGLAAIRAFRNKPNIRIVGMTHTPSEIGYYSRYLSEKVVMPHPGKDEDKFISFMKSKIEEIK